MRKISLALIILLGFSLFSLGSQATEKTYTLTMHHFLSSNSPAHKDFLVPWAKKIEEASKERIKIDIYPSMSSGGKPNELYGQVRDGAFDLVWTLAGYTPGIFPRVEVFELPTVHQGSAVVTTQAIYENMDLIKEDFKDVESIIIHSSAGNALHTKNKEIKSATNLKGLKLRSPSRTGSWYITDLGAKPVGMPLPALPQALSKGAVDGMLMPFEIFPPYKMQQLTKKSFEGPKGARFGTSIFMLLMNKDKFNSLPKDLQKIIKDNSDAAVYKQTGELFDKVEEPGKALQIKAGGEVVKFTPKQWQEFETIGQKVVNQWIKEVNNKGINGKKLVDEARKSIKKFSK